MSPALTFHRFQTDCVPHIDEHCDTTEATKVANSVIVFFHWLCSEKLLYVLTHTYTGLHSDMPVKLLIFKEVLLTGY